MIQFSVWTLALYTRFFFFVCICTLWTTSILYTLSAAEISCIGAFCGAGSNLGEAKFGNKLPLIFNEIEFNWRKKKMFYAWIMDRHVSVYVCIIFDRTSYLLAWISRIAYPQASTFVLLRFSNIILFIRISVERQTKHLKTQ